MGSIDVRPGRVLVAESSRELREALRRYLTAEGFQVVAAEDGGSALQLVRQHEPDIIVADLDLPVLSGMELCRTLREDGVSQPLIMLTPTDATVDRIVSLEIGADDCLSKPVDSRELLARIRAHLRRCAMSESLSVRRDRGGLISAGDLQIDLDARTITRHGARMDLPPRAFSLLAFLAARPGRVIRREELLEQIWGESVIDSRTVDVHVAHIRKVIEDDASNPRHLQTVRGVGYRFEV